jgi:anti-anti-sigma factor
MSQPAFEVRPDSRGVLWLSGELDLVVADAFVKRAMASLDGQPELVLDCSGLTFLDSSGLRAMLALSSQAGGRPVVVRNAPEHVRKVLEIAGVARLGVRVESEG